MSSYRERYQDFYNGKEWKELRDWKFADANGLCEECRENGKIVVGKEVHHIIPIEKDWEKRLDANNLKLLCPECHNSVHSRESQLQKFNKFWEELENGEIAECEH